MIPRWSGAAMARAVARERAARPHVVVRLALYALMFSLPFEMPDRTSIPVEIPNLVGAVFLGVALLQPGLVFARTPAAVLCFAGYLYAFIVSFAHNGSAHPFQVVYLFVLYLEGFLVLYTAYNLFRYEDVARQALTVLGLACVLRAVLPWVGIGATAHAVETGGDRITAFGQNANNSAMILAAGLLSLLGLAMLPRARGTRLRLLTPVLCAMIAASIMETGSRGGLLCLMAGLAMFGLSGDTRRVRMRNALVGVMGIGLLAFGAAHTEVMRNRIENVAETGYMAGREEIYPTLWRMFREKPAFGWGPINNKYELGMRLWEQKRRRRDSHNIVLEVLSASGVVGIIPFAIAIAICALSAWRARKGPHRMLPLALLASLLVANMSGDWIAGKLFWLDFAYVLAATSFIPARRVERGGGGRGGSGRWLAAPAPPAAPYARRTWPAPSAPAASPVPSTPADASAEAPC